MLPLSHRLLPIAKIGCFLALMAWGHLTYAQQSPSASAATEKPEADSSQVTDRNDNRNEKKNLGDFALPVRIITDSIDDKNKEDRENSDLKAQWTAADAAVKSADFAKKGYCISILQLVLSALSAVLLIWTLHESRRTAKAALEQSQIAKKTLRHTKESDRPFLHPISAFLISDVQPRYVAKINVANNGTSIAVIRSISAISITSDKEVHHTTPNSPPRFHMIKPGYDDEIAQDSFIFFINNEEYLSLLNQERTLYLHVTIKYTRVTETFGWTTTFKFVFCPISRDNGGELRWEFEHWSEPPADE